MTTKYSPMTALALMEELQREHDVNFDLNSKGSDYHCTITGRGRVCHSGAHPSADEAAYKAYRMFTDD
jgi:hypothetical protein